MGEVQDVFLHQRLDPLDPSKNEILASYSSSGSS
jgi:hypothetical protein